MNRRSTIIFALTLVVMTAPFIVFAQAPNAGAAAQGDPSAVFGPVMGTIMSWFAYLMGISGVLLNQVMHYTVVHMGDYVHGLAAIDVAWRVLRDIGNIVLIFGFLAVGIATIIDARIYGGGTKMLPILLIVAVLLNFSLFIAEAVIDVGNLFATQVYTQINGGTLASAPSPGNEGISNTIMQNIGLQTFYNVNGQQPASWNVATMITGLLGILLFLVAAFVMFSLSFMLVSRFVILLLLIIVSPLGFAGLVVPKLEGIAKKWWDMLFKQTLTAPVLLLTLYVALKVITDPCFLGSAGTGGVTCTGLGTTQGSAKDAYISLIRGSTDDITRFAGVLLSFLVAMGLLMACVVIAKEMSARGASWATRWGGALSFGVVAFAGRRTLGRGSNAVARTIRSSRLGQTTWGRTFAGVADYGAKASFDVRGSKTVKAGLDEYHIDAGKPKEGGYKKIQDEAVKSRVDYAKSLQLTGAQRKEESELKTRLTAAQLERNAKVAAAEAAGDDGAKKRAQEAFAKIESEIQNGMFDAAGKQVKRGLKDFKGLPQRTYAKSLEKVAGWTSPGTWLNAAYYSGAGVAGGVAAGSLVGAAGVGAAGGAAVGAVYLASTAPQANREAGKRILGELGKSDADKLREALEEAGKKAASGGAPAAGGGH